MKKTNSATHLSNLKTTLEENSGYYGAKSLLELIYHPNQPIHATRLRHLFNQPATPAPAEVSQPSFQRRLESSSVLPFSTNPLWELPIEKADRKAIASVKQRLVSVIEQIAQAREYNDLARLEDLQDEQDKLMDWLKQAVNKFGRPRYLMDNTQKDYQAVRKNILKLIRLLEQTDPKQAKYIREHLKTGHRFVWKDNLFS